MTEKKKEYVTPEIEVVLLEFQDILTTSGNPDSGGSSDPDESLDFSGGSTTPSIPGYSQNGWV